MVSKTKLSDEQVARKRKDKHAKHDAEQKLEKREHKYKQLDWVDNSWVDHNETD